VGQDRDIQEFLAEEGFSHPDARDAALKVLCDAGLTRAGKARMVETKLDTARELLQAQLIVTCSSARCQGAARAQAPRARVPAGSPGECEFCQGSNNAQAIEDMVRQARQCNINRLLIIGGSPGTRDVLTQLVAGRLAVRVVDGTVRRTSAQAREDMAWAQLVVIWGSTELAHRVSTLYTRAAHSRTISVSRRGIVALAAAVVRTLS
jgi:hypothetical protein